MAVLTVGAIPLVLARGGEHHATPRLAGVDGHHFSVWFDFGQAGVVSGAGDQSVVKLRVAADASAFPIWPESDAARRLRIPEDLHLSARLIDDLRAWAAVHDRARTDRWNFDWTESVARERDWIEQGRTLAALVQSELGDEYEVVFPYE